MSHELHSVIDQAVDRTQHSSAPRSTDSSAEILEDRLSKWQAELASFLEEFQRDSSALRDDLANLTTKESPLTASTVEAVPVERPTQADTAPVDTANDAVPASDQQQGRLSALRERLSQQLGTRPEETDYGTSRPPVSEQGEAQ